MNRVRLLLAAALVISASAFAVPAVTDAAVNYFDKTVTVTKTMTAAEIENRNYGTDPISLTVACASGYRVTGGGYSVSTGSPGDNGIEPYWQFNAVQNRPYAQGWRTTLKSLYGNSGMYAPSFSVYAICTR